MDMNRTTQSGGEGEYPLPQASRVRNLQPPRAQQAHSTETDNGTRRSDNTTVGLGVGWSAPSVRSLQATTTERGRGHQVRGHTQHTPLTWAGTPLRIAVTDGGSITVIQGGGYTQRVAELSLKGSSARYHFNNYHTPPTVSPDWVRNGWAGVQVLGSTLGAEVRDGHSAHQQSKSRGRWLAQPSILAGSTPQRRRPDEICQ